MQTEQAVPKLRFPGFSELRNVKVLWELSDVRDWTHDSPKYQPSWYPLITSKNLNSNWTLDLDNVSYISEEDYISVNKRSWVQKWDILFWMIWTIGNPVLLRDDGFAIKNVALIKEKSSWQNNFLIHRLRWREVARQFYELNAWWTQKFIALWVIRWLKIHLPSPEEQTRIATFLSLVDRMIQLLTKKKEFLEQYKKGVMQKIFSQEVRFKDENGEDFPEWEDNQLGNICNITTGKLDANAMVEKWQYRFYTCAKDYYYIDSYAFDTDALLISWNGANVWYVHHYTWKFNAYQRTYVLDGFNDNILYIKTYLDKNLAKRIFKEKKEGNTPYIVMATLSNMIILIPSIVEQATISEFVENLSKKILFVSQQKKSTVAWKKWLLQQMFV